MVTHKATGDDHPSCKVDWASVMVTHKATSFPMCCGNAKLSTQLSEKPTEKVVRRRGRQNAINTHKNKSESKELSHGDTSSSER